MKKASSAWVLGFVQLVILLFVVGQACATSSVSWPARPKSSQRGEHPGSSIYLYAGESILRSASGLLRVAVGDPKVADIKVVEGDTFLLNGVGKGHTTLMVWDEQGVQSIDLVVTARPPLELAYVERLLAAWSIKPSWWMEYLIIQGTVASETDKEAVENLVKTIWEPVISLVVVADSGRDAAGEVEKESEGAPAQSHRSAEDLLTQEIQGALTMREVEIQAVRDLVILSGEVKTNQDRLRAERIALQFAPEVLNLIQVAEVSESMEREPGVGNENELASTVRGRESSIAIEDIEALCTLWGYTLKPLGGLLILEGEVSTPQQKAAVIDLLEVYQLPYVDATTAKTLSANKKELASLKAMLQELPGLREASVSQRGNRLVIEGYGLEPAAIKLAEELVRDYGAPRGMEISNLLHIPTESKPRPSGSLIQAEMGIPGLVVRWVGDTLVLEGTLYPKARNAAVALAAQYASQVVDLTSEKVLSTMTLAEIENLIATDSVTVSNIENNVVLLGTLPSLEHREAVIGLASAFGYPVIDALMVVSGEEDKPFVVTAAEVNNAIGLETVQAQIVNGAIVLEGEVGGPLDHARARAIASTFDRDVVDLIEVVVKSESVEDNWEPLVLEAAKWGTLLYKVASTPVLEGEVTQEIAAYLEALLDNEFAHWINHLTVLSPPPTPLPSLELVKASLGHPDIDCHYIGDTLVLQGEVASLQERQRLVSMASLVGVPVQSFLEVRDDIQQVWVDVCMVELSYNNSQELGIEWDLGLGTSEEVIDEVLLPWELPGESPKSSSRSAFSLLVGPLWATTNLLSLLRSGEARILASPSLLTENGKRAEFLAGGEIPVPAELQGVEWKSYGVGLTVTPTVLENGSIHLELQPEVSSLDWENAVQLEDAVVPGVRTRRWRTQAAVAPGKALVIGGLLSEEESTRQRQVPILGELPILGALFRSEVRARQKTDLVVLVSPRLVREKDHLWMNLLAEP